MEWFHFLYADANEREHTHTHTLHGPTRFFTVFRHWRINEQTKKNDSYRSGRQKMYILYTHINRRANENRKNN